MKCLVLFLLLAMSSIVVQGQEPAWWHGKERTLRYRPVNGDFVIENGKRRFVRALYGTNTAFRVEAGDLPEFGLYMPGMGGNLKFGLIKGGQSKWLIDAKTIRAIYRPGAMLYEIRDPMLGVGKLTITVLCLADSEGVIIKTAYSGNEPAIGLVWAFGGASGKKFSRDGDVGADPESSFYLHPENCRDNRFVLGRNTFQLSYGSGKVLTEEERYEIQHIAGEAKNALPDTKNMKYLAGLFPLSATIRLSDASSQLSPLTMITSVVDKAPALIGRMQLTRGDHYFLIEAGRTTATNYLELPSYFEKAEAKRYRLAGRVKVSTPDEYINTIGGALCIAADAIWEDPSYLHGAVAWRMRLNAWRGAYVADPLGWHDRARKHFSSYALSQVTTPPVTGVVMDTALHLARHLEKIGTALFSDGYICRNPNGDIRAHHYDMNLVFIDQLLNHFNWTGDRQYVKEMWPLIKRHLAWEKRNFDSDGDGLYDAYAAIWASDALQYSGGGVTHSSAYNYRANRMAAQLATIAGEDGMPYKDESEKILAAVQSQLWLPSKGVYAEYKDLLGNKLVHPSPGLWTIYHAIDSKLPNPFQAYECLSYIDNEIPHIPVRANGLKEDGLHVLATTNWQPYTWSLNNVALGENLHTALAYWQGNRSEEAYRLWRSMLIESMYLGASPGGFEQLSFYDAMRGELYRDFADGIGMAGRTLVEGLFGIQPAALDDTLTISPGWPMAWEHAGLQIPDVVLNFRRKGMTDSYRVRQLFTRKLALKLVLPVYAETITAIRVNGRAVSWDVDPEAVGKPRIVVRVPASPDYQVIINWSGERIEKVATQHRSGETSFDVKWPSLKIISLLPGNSTASIQNGGLHIARPSNDDQATAFAYVQQGQMRWWQPFSLIKDHQNPLAAEAAGKDDVKTQVSKIDLRSFFNDKVTNIFRHQYLAPRPKGPTLQLPTQGIGNWCYPLTTANIDDSATRALAGTANEIRSMTGVPFFTPSDTTQNNVVFASQWDNFPKSVHIPLTGTASRLSLLMAGSTNAMQCHVTNGRVIVAYKDGSADTLELRNPENWWPIEQDFYIDGYAFTNGNASPPERLYFKQGKFARGLSAYSGIKGYSNMAVDGGAGTVLSMLLSQTKELKSLTIEAVANDVIIGLMAATLSK